MLVVFNQDPRFGADVLGLADAHIPRDLFFNQVIPGQTTIDVIGHMVGEHVMFVQEVLTELVDPDAEIQITADRFVIRVAAGEARVQELDACLAEAAQEATLLRMAALSLPLSLSLCFCSRPYTSAPCPFEDIGHCLEMRCGAHWTVVVNVYTWLP
jgi:hypothetical protein